MRYATTPEASRLTGLSIEKLREWTSRRALIPSDIPPKCKGSPARYGWQTVLILRLAVTVRDRLHLELQAHKALFDSLRDELRDVPFGDLWGKTLAVHGGSRWQLVGDIRTEMLTDETILMRLDPHLEVVAAGFDLPNASTRFGQIELFPLKKPVAQTELSDSPILKSSLTEGNAAQRAIA